MKNLFSTVRLFFERFAGEEGYFSGPGKRYQIRDVATWDNNFIADVSSAGDRCVREQKGVGALITCFEIAGNSLVGHLSQWPAGFITKPTITDRVPFCLACNRAVMYCCGPRIWELGLIERKQ